MGQADAMNKDELLKALRTAYAHRGHDPSGWNEIGALIARIDEEVLADDRNGSLERKIQGDRLYWTLDWYPFWDGDRFEDVRGYIPVHIIITKRLPHEQTTEGGEEP